MDSMDNPDGPSAFILKPAYEDDSIIIVNKPQGLAVTPGGSPSLCEQVFAVYPELGEVRGYKQGEGGLLNRLDNETGGLVIFAKTEKAFEYYAALLKAEQVVKEYTAVVSRKPSVMSGAVSVPIAHHHKSKKRMVAVTAVSAAAGKPGHGMRYRGKPRAALTRWEFVGEHEYGYVLAVTITRGVRHQIRVHLAHAGMPVVGDKLYNRSGPETACHLLYARGLRFTTFFGKHMAIEVEVPFLLP